jgi:uncharacterized protein (TIGR00299 family) protein
MTLGALLDAGVPPEVVRGGIRSLGMPDVEIEIATVKKCGFRATGLKIKHGEQKSHRHLHHIDAMIDGATEIEDDAKQLAKQIFLNLGRAEALVHGTTLQKVHFHEVGAIDSIADIVGTAIAMRWFQIDAVEASPVPTGTGFITIDHGRVSIPAPATAELLKDIPLAGSSIEAELTTPTGAAILKTTARRFGPVPEMRIEAIGYGAGSRDLQGQPNVLRLLVGQMAEAASAYPVEVDQVVVLETNIDNTTGEDLAGCVDRLWQSGAIDIYQSPCQMKKGRTGTEIKVLAAPSRVVDLQEILFTHGGTIGVRQYTTSRHKLIRRRHVVETSLGPIVGKCVWLPQGVWRFSIEYDQASELAASRQMTVDQVRRLAHAAFESGPSLEPPNSANSG